MANELEVQELKDKVAALVQSKYGGDFQRAFAQYDSDHDGKISKSELKALLGDAGIGNVFTRSAWVDGIIGELDKNDDAAISWAEFEAALVE